MEAQVVLPAAVVNYRLAVLEPSAARHCSATAASEQEQFGISDLPISPRILA